MEEWKGRNAQHCSQKNQKYKKGNNKEENKT